MLPTLIPSPPYYSCSKLIFFLKSHPTHFREEEERKEKGWLFLEYPERVGRGGCEWTRDPEIPGVVKGVKWTGGTCRGHPKGRSLML